MTLTILRSLASYLGLIGLGDETGYIVAFNAKNPDQAQPSESVLVNQGVVGGDANAVFLVEAVLWGGDVPVGESHNPVETVTEFNTGSEWILEVSGQNGLTEGSLSAYNDVHVAVGNPETVTGTPNTGAGYVSASQWTLDGTLVSTTASAANASYTVAAQTTGSHHTLIAKFTYGWCLTCTGTTADGYHDVASGGGYTATASGTLAQNYHWQWSNGSQASSTTVSAQPNGSYYGNLSVMQVHN
jgi:hypothetical protein